MTKTLVRMWSRLVDHRWSLAILFLLPVFANAVALSGIFNNDPTLQFIGLGIELHGGLLPGPMSWLDPTVGYITQPIGHLVASDWLHGIVPWWNPYSGLGMPLAAEMQSAVFFLPFVLLLHWNCGWLLLRVLLQISCGLFAYAFLVEIKLRRVAAVLGGALYSLSPLFFLSPHAAINPLPFLPLLLLGIEHTAKAAQDHKKLGWSLVVIATAYSILGGFPETAFLDGMLAAMWTLWRFSTLSPALWLRYAGKLGVALVIALGICAPLLIPFFEYLPHANIGPHSGALFTHNRLEATLVPLQIFPFLYGLLGSLPPDSIAGAFGGGWVRLPSWVGIPVLTLAISALWRRGQRVQPRYVLLAWIILWEARYIGLAPAVWLMNHIPGLATSDIIRFSGPMLAFSVFCLASMGLDDYLECGAMRLWRQGGVIGTVLLIILAAMTPIFGFLFSWWEQRPFDMLIGCMAGQLVILISIFLCWELSHPRHSRALVALLLAGPFLAFVYPQFAGFRGGKIDLAPIHFLQANEGTDRMVSLGPLDLNFPSRYGIASIDYASMPTPLDWTRYVQANLFSKVDPNIYAGSAPGERTYLLQHLPDYEALGVRYIVAGANTNLAAKPFPVSDLANDVIKQNTVPYGVKPDADDFTGNMVVDLSSTSIKAASVYVGTYRGLSRGSLILTLCASGRCETAANDVGQAKDTAPLMFQFPSPLIVPHGALLNYRFSHPNGTQVAIWLVPAGNGAEVPSFAFIGSNGVPVSGNVGDNLTLVFKDNAASIYRLANTAPYASSPDADCRIDIVSRQEMRTSCVSQGRLLRRELYFPGWSANVNGTAEKVSRAGIFEAIALPKGSATVLFSYAPPHMRLALLFSIAAFIVWLVLILSAINYGDSETHALD